MHDFIEILLIPWRATFGATHKGTPSILEMILFAILLIGGTCWFGISSFLARDEKEESN